MLEKDIYLIKKFVRLFKYFKLEDEYIASFIYLKRMHMKMDINKEWKYYVYLSLAFAVSFNTDYSKIEIGIISRYFKMTKTEFLNRMYQVLDEIDWNLFVSHDIYQSLVDNYNVNS